jgi:hypothetical protein
MPVRAIIDGIFGIVTAAKVPTYRRGELLKSNAQVVENVVRLAGELGREVATPQQARQLFRTPEAAYIK